MSSDPRPKPDHSSSDYAPYPKLDPKDTAPVPPTWTASASTMPAGSNPYVSPAPAPGPGSSVKNRMDEIKDAFGKLGKKAAEKTKKAEDLAGNVWQHLKTAPSVADAAVGRIAQGAKILAEGGYEKVFRQAFETLPEEKLLNAYACYLSTSTGPIMGTLYLSSAKLAFCSDNPVSYIVGDQTQWCYYKVILPIDKVKSVNPSASKVNPAEKYIQIISVDSHEFWFMGFVNYDGAVNTLQGALQGVHP